MNKNAFLELDTYFDPGDGVEMVKVIEGLIWFYENQFDLSTSHQIREFLLYLKLRKATKKDRETNLTVYNFA